MPLWGVKWKRRRHEHLKGLALVCAGGILWMMLAIVCMSQQMNFWFGQEEELAASHTARAFGTGLRHNPQLLLVVLPLAGRHDPRGVRALIERLVVRHWGLVTAELLRLWPSSNDDSDSLAPPVVVRIYGIVAHGETCDEALEENNGGPPAGGFECIVLNRHCAVPDFGDIPTVPCIFDAIHAKLASLGRVTSAAAPQQPWVVLANSDILFSPRALASILVTVMGHGWSLVDSGTARGKMSPALLSAIKGSSVVLVGQRTDVPVALGSLEHAAVDDRLAFDSFVQTLLHESSSSSLHPDFGIDYFVLPARLLPRTFPPFLVGRFRWDNALLAQYVLSSTVATVDITSVATALHIGNAFSSDPSYHRARRGAGYNNRLAEQRFHHAYTLGRIHNTELVLRGGQEGASQGYRLDARPAQVDLDILTAWRRAAHEAATDGNGTETQIHPFVLLVPTLPHDLARVRLWMDHAGPGALLHSQMPALRWLQQHSVLVTTDQQTYAMLDALYPGAVLLEERTVGAAGWSLAYRCRTFDRLLGMGMAVAIASIDELALSSSDMERMAKLWRRCDVTKLNGAIQSVQPTPTGLEYHYNRRRARSKAFQWIELRGTGWACLVAEKQKIAT